MLIFYTSSLSGPEHRFRFNYELAGPPNYCCPAMVQLWNEIILFGFGGLPQRQSNLRAFCTFNCFQEDGVVSTEEVGITHCPWCGKQIKMVRVDDAGNPVMLAAVDPLDDPDEEGEAAGERRESWES